MAVWRQACVSASLGLGSRAAAWARQPLAAGRGTGMREVPQRVPWPCHSPAPRFLLLVSALDQLQRTGRSRREARVEGSGPARRPPPGRAGGTSGPFSPPSVGTRSPPRGRACTPVSAGSSRPPLWAPLEKASVSGETDCAGWKLLSPRRTADFHVTDAVRSEGRGHGARGREAGCTPQGPCGESAEEGRERAQGVWARPRLPRPRGAGGAWVGSRMPLARSCRAQGSPPSWTADGLAPLSLWPACNLPGGPLSRDRQERPLGRLGVFRSSAWPSGVLEDSAARLLAAGGSVCTCSAHTYRVPTVRQVWN